MAKVLWEWKQRFAIGLVIHGLTAVATRDVPYSSTNHDSTDGIVVSSYNVKSLKPGDAYKHQWISSSLVQVMAWHLFSPKPLVEPVLTYCQFDSKKQASLKFWLNSRQFHLSWPQWVNTLWSRDDIWQGTGSTLVQVMARCLSAPSHYSNQCWLISKVRWQSSSQSNFVRDVCH